MLKESEIGNIKIQEEESGWIYSPQGVGIRLDHLRKVYRDSFEEFRGIPVGQHKDAKNALMERLEVWSTQYEALNAAWEKNPSDRTLRRRAGEAWVRKQYLYERLYALRTVTHHAVEVGTVPSYNEWNLGTKGLPGDKLLAEEPTYSELFDLSSEQLKSELGDCHQKPRLHYEHRFKFGTTWREQYDGIVAECARFGIDKRPYIYNNHRSMRTALHHFAKRSSI